MHRDYFIITYKMLGNGTVRINLLNSGAHTSSKACNKNIPRCRIHRFTKLQQLLAPPEDCAAKRHNRKTPKKMTEERERVQEKGRRRFSQLLLGSVSSDSWSWLHSQFFPLSDRNHGRLVTRRGHLRCVRVKSKTRKVNLTETKNATLRRRISQSSI